MGPKIVTVTLHPALDVSFAVERMVPDHKMAGVAVRRDPGGGGVNVARVLQRFGLASSAFAIVGGPIGTELVDLLLAEGIDVRPFPTDGNTREAFAMTDRATGRQYRAVLPGPAIDDVDAVVADILTLAADAEIVVFSGNAEAGLPPDLINNVIESLGPSVTTIVDTFGSPLQVAAMGSASVLKPSQRELGQVVGWRPETDQEIEQAAREVLDAGQVGAIVVSCGARGALLIPRGGPATWFSPPIVEPVSTVGAGDSLVAGIVAGLVRAEDLAEAVRYGVAAGTAAVLTSGTQLCDPADVERLSAGVVPRPSNDGLGSVGVLVVGRPTFDLPYAAQLASDALETLRAVVPDVRGDAIVNTTTEMVANSRSEFLQHCDTVVIVHGTFTDATLPMAALEDHTGRVVLWALPELRTPDRLRLNSFCGMNLSAFELARTGRITSYLYAAPDDPNISNRLAHALAAAPTRPDFGPVATADGIASADLERADAVVARLDGAVIGVIGDAPDGFGPCQPMESDIASTIGSMVDRLPIEALFDAADQADTAVGETRLESVFDGPTRFRSSELAPSLRLQAALGGLAEERSWAGVAVRCWPECFTVYGGAVCAPLALLNDAGLTTACEADVGGAITSLILRELSGTPAFLADLVDLDEADNTGTFWHCGVAPPSMAAPGSPPRAGAHPNRGVPLTVEFGIRSGRVTIARFSQSRGRLRLVAGAGQVLDEPAPFRGTGGIVRFDREVSDVLATITGEGLEHHYGLVYGDHTEALRGIAARWGIALVEL